MNIYVSTMTLLGLYLAGVLLVLFVGRLIIRTDLYRRWTEKRGKHYRRSRIIEELRPVQQTMIDFIDASPLSRELLQRLAETDEPIPVRKLLANTTASEKSWIALFIISLAGLVRFGREGALITSAGREVLVVLKADTTAPTRETLELVDSRSEVSKAKLPSVRAQRAALRPKDSENRSPATITAADYRELASAIVAARKLAVHQAETRQLQGKLAHAVISVRRDLSPDVITMYSRAELVDLETDERLNLMLVFPIDANLEQGRISVFHPLGAGMLGRRVGDQLEWAVPYGVRRFEVKAIHFQPEAALAHAA